MVLKIFSLTNPSMFQKIITFCIICKQWWSQRPFTFPFLPVITSQVITVIILVFFIPTYLHTYLTKKYCMCDCDVCVCICVCGERERKLEQVKERKREHEQVHRHSMCCLVYFEISIKRYHCLLSLNLFFSQHCIKISSVLT